VQLLISPQVMVEKSCSGRPRHVCDGRCWRENEEREREGEGEGEREREGEREGGREGGREREREREREKEISRACISPRAPALAAVDKGSAFGLSFFKFKQNRMQDKRHRARAQCDVPHRCMHCEQHVNWTPPAIPLPTHSLRSRHGRMMLGTG